MCNKIPSLSQKQVSSQYLCLLHLEFFCLVRCKYNGSLTSTVMQVHTPPLHTSLVNNQTAYKITCKSNKTL